MRLLLVSLVGTSSLAVAGCTATGQTFGPAEAPPSDKGLVYFYRPQAFPGSANDLMLVDNGAPIQRIQNGQFIKYLAAPGRHTFHTDTIAIDQPLEFEVLAGETYFVRTGLRQGFWTGTWYLSRVFPEEAVTELQTCCKSGAN